MMKKLLLGLLAPLVLATAACSANQVLASIPVVGNVCEAADQTLIDEKVVWTAHAIYNVPAQAYVTANRAGQLSPELKAKLKPMLRELYRYDLAIKAAQGSVNCDFASMKELQVRVLELLPKRS